MVFAPPITETWPARRPSWYGSGRRQVSFHGTVFMDPQVWVMLAAVFVAGGAIGSAGTLLTQWILRKVDLAPPQGALGPPEYRTVRKELAELGRHMRNVDARLDFAEQLLGGALTVAPPPSRLAPLEPAPEEEEDAEESGGEEDAQ